jgi:hypothetical protein
MYTEVQVLCSKKDAIDIDTLSDFQDLVEKLIENDTNKLTVYYDLDDVKRAAKVFFLCYYVSIIIFTKLFNSESVGER